MPALISFLISMLGRLFGVATLKWIAQKGLILFMGTLVLPAVLYNLFGKIFEEMVQKGMSVGSEGIGGVVSQGDTVLALTGMAGWIAIQIGLSSCLAVFISALGIRYALHIIRG